MRYNIRYCPSKHNGQANALLRNPDWDGGRDRKHVASLIQPVEVDAVDMEGLATVAAAVVVDGLAERLKEAIAGDEGVPAELTGPWASENGALHFGGKVYVPRACRAEVLALVHDAPTAGHPGRDKTVKLARRNV
jgi:hypothetical protein